MKLDDLPSWLAFGAVLWLVSIVLLAMLVPAPTAEQVNEFEQANDDMVVGGEPAVQWPQSVVALLGGAVALVVVRFRNANRGGENDGD